MTLVHEDISHDEGYGRCASCCRIRVYAHRIRVYAHRIRMYAHRSGALVIVASELTGELAYLGENAGTSITNMAEGIATAWRARYPDRPIVWIEHYPARGSSWTRNGQRVWQFGETVDRVRFTWDNRAQRYRRPQWSHLGRAAAEALIGAAWPEPQALDEERYRRHTNG